VGRNAAGKSNLFEVFQFFRDARDEGLDDAIQLQGGVEYLQNKSLEDRQNLLVEMKFSSDREFFECRTENSETWQSRVENRIFINEIDFYRGDYLVVQDKYTKSVVGRQTESGGEQELERNAKVMSKLFESPHSTIEHTVQRSLEYFVNDFETEVDWIAESIVFEAPEFGATFDIRPKEIASESTLKGRTDLQPDGSNLALVIKKLLEDDDQKQKFLSLVSDVLPFVSDTKVEAMPDQSLFLEILEEFEPGQDQYIPAEMLSDGTLRVLALIYLLYFSDHEKIFIEEPGRNIHPSLIANLMLKVKDAAENTDKQIFLTTHNVEVLRHTPPEDVRLVSRDEDGFTQVERPAESERVQKFLENDLGMVDLYTENMLGE
jgi:predicted ATPase